MSVDRPTLQESADRLQADPSDPVFSSCHAAAILSQDMDCHTLTYDSRLREALERRVANLWASKAHTLGVLDTGADFGASYVPQYDPVVDGLERPYRKTTTVVA